MSLLLPTGVAGSLRHSQILHVSGLNKSNFSCLYRKLYNPQKHLYGPQYEITTSNSSFVNCLIIDRYPLRNSFHCSCTHIHILEHSSNPEVVNQCRLSHYRDYFCDYSCIISTFTFPISSLSVRKWSAVFYTKVCQKYESSKFLKIYWDCIMKMCYTCTINS